MASAVPVTSQPQLFDEPPTKGISLSPCKVTSLKTHILDSDASDTAQTQLHAPLPEICFGNNSLSVLHEPSGLKLEWNTLDALKAVGKDTEVKVAYADEWARGQAKGEAADVEVQKPYDWTYTTVWPGSVSHPSPSPPPSFVPAPPSHPGIPLHLLARQDIPILFFDEIPLFEDELGDNGIADLTIRVRVNSFSIFILSRFFLRIDHVLFRIFDVRLYIPLPTPADPSPQIIRECKGRQASYSDVKARLPYDRPEDLTPLTDINWVHAQLEALSQPQPPSRFSPSTRPPPPSTRSPALSGESTPTRFPSPATVPTRMGHNGLQEAVGRLSLAESPSSVLSSAAQGEAVLDERKFVERPLPTWQAEGVRLEVMDLPQSAPSN